MQNDIKNNGEINMLSQKESENTANEKKQEIKTKTPSYKYICVNCKSPETKTDFLTRFFEGSLGLISIFLSVSLIGGLFSLLLPIIGTIFGVFIGTILGILIYSKIQTYCYKCNKFTLIPIHTAKGQELYNEFLNKNNKKD